ncbi:MAG: preprotein translocase subunit SecY [Planctomycetes bacterium]|nr:preprotein translocase subunit SecY [Planctomycetota bacterium]
MAVLESFRNVFKIAELRKRIFFTLVVLLVFRLGAHIVLPGINPEAVRDFRDKMAAEGGDLFNLIQIFSGFALGNLALFSLGIMPYITSSIIMQLMTKVSPALETISKEPGGQRKIQQYTRYLAIPVCIIQGFFAVQSLAAYQRDSGVPLLTGTGFGTYALLILGLAGGALFIMWLGEQITEHGLGNGASILIMAGIIARLPATIWELIREARQGAISGDSIVIILALYIAAIFAIVFITQAQRRIPLQHAKHIRGRRMMSGGRNYLPLRVNTSGVMPVIFASSLLILPQMLGMVPGLKVIADAFDRGWFFYTVFYISMIFFFSYFWTYLFFQPQEIANNLKEYGSFIPGIRPGENTAQYINTILSRITLCGAAFLCIIALVPDLVSAAFGGSLQRRLLSFMGGTGILIVVGVGLDVIQKMESHLLLHHYDGFTGTSGIRGRR